MRALVYHVASSLDGYIAKPDGSVHGFVNEGQHIPDYLNSLKTYDTVIMGRKTYEFAYGFGLKPGEVPPFYTHMRNYVLSSTLQVDAQEGLEIVRENFLPFIQKLKEETGTDIYLCGGGHLAGLLLDHGLIDKVILKMNPVIFGEGIPLFGQSTKEMSWKLMDSMTYDSGVSLLTFSLK